MTEKAKKELHDKIIYGLQSKDSVIITNSINQLREEGQLKDIVILFDLLLTNKDEHLKNTILNFLADIKDKKAETIFIDALLNDKYNSLRKEIAGVCWQSSIDFSNHLNVFVDLLINSEFETAFEAFTVIENFEETCDPKQVNEAVQKLKSAVKNAPEQVKGIIQECIRIFGNE
jgi:hypothetical protein